MKVGLSPDHIVLDGDPAPPKRGTAPHFWAYAYFGQTAGWITIPGSTKVDLGPGHIVLDGDSVLTSQIRGTAPHFWSMSIVAKWSPISAIAEHL